MKMGGRIARVQTAPAKLMALLFSLAIALTMASPLLAQAEEITGGGNIDSNGTYTLASDATGTIEIGGGLNVTVQGLGADNFFSGLSLSVGEGTTLTIENLYATQGSAGSTIDFKGNGALNIAGENLIDNVGGLNAAVIHVPAGASVSFDGTGTLYGYKSALCSYIGGNNGEANGAITFNGGYWFIKGTKTGSVIGGDSATDKGGDITINGGELYIKGVARGALIGGSNQGKAGDVYVTGGLVELFEDFTGPAIGAGNSANAANVTITGGSLKTVLSSNSANQYGQAATFNGMPGVSWAAVQALNASDYALLTLDVSSYISNLSTDTVDVYVDGGDKPFYSGRAYTYVTNEVKNPTNSENNNLSTMENWLTNDASWLVTADDYGTSAYPSKNGSSFVPEKNLYLALSKEDHTLSVGGDRFIAKWDSEAGSFTLKEIPCKWYDPAAESYEISTSEQLAELAGIVNGSYVEDGVAQSDFAGKTVKLTDNIDLSGIADWTAIGNKNAKFAGTFDGQGKTISGLHVTSAGGYKGLFGNNAGTVTNFTISGNMGAADATIGNGDFVAAAVAYNTGTVSNIISTVEIYPGAGETYSVGGIVGCNDGGTVSQCGFEGKIASDTSKKTYRVGGIVGYQTSGTISECYNTADVEAWNYRNGNQGVGGILGSMDGGTVSYCYNTGTIRNGKGDGGTGGKQGTGGIVGASAEGDVTNCYAVGETYAPASSGIIAGKLGAGKYNHLFTLNTTRAYNDKGAKTGDDGIKYMDGTDENADGSIKYKGAALANSYIDGYTISDSYTVDDATLKSDIAVVRLNTAADGSYNAAFAKSDNGYPVLAWQGGSAIEKDSLTAEGISGIDAKYAKTDAGVSPTVEVSYGGIKLIEGFDYTLSYATKNGTEVNAPFTQSGGYVATVDAGYIGKPTVEFTVLPSADEISVADIDDQEYTGSAVEPELKVTYKDADGKEVELVAGEDYAVKFTNNVSAGEAKAMVVGSDDYPFQTVVKFQIKSKSLSNGFTIADIPDQLATGSAIKPSVTLTDDKTGAKLVEGTDYEVLYYSNTKAGTAKVKAAGIGNYAGATAQKSFTIYTLDLADATVTAKAATYKGSALKPAVTVTYKGTVIPADTYQVTWDGSLVNAGAYALKVTGKSVGVTGDTTCDFKVAKASQSLSVKTNTCKVKYSKLKKSTRSISAKTAFKVSGAKGKVTYAKSSGNKKITVSKSGKITVKKGLKKGTYKVKVKVSSASTANYNASSKTVTVKVVVK